ncbi:Uncharacterized protein YfkK, UPF0435 family [Pelagirhabdus alkalitolerans]|uniref:Uncharacterized protein YfkK, UPF0435 family n=1 Tax=Pelagirhabdus alkalitolerans TaxID=1612202 RepID=A0A1G6H2D6_9BACI|nr:DUF1128 domain-containing protein [Pelagirhabdus alkalitolerans]SDB88313.1 Uncharacterized protein YfkK, UPF0435 family [Pelagirhabdus alkalitolerans]
MNLNKATEENLAYVLKGIQTKLGVVNESLFDPEDYSIDKYDDLLFLYNHIASQSHLSPSETTAFIDELANSRKK